MQTNQETAQQIRDLTIQVSKSRDEIVGKIAQLEEAISNSGNTSNEVESALAELKTAVQGIDDVVPDAPTV